MRIKDWPKFQHFKDRRPPWIKLYRDILDDDEWFSLPPISAKALVTLWLLASEDETKQGILPPFNKIAFRLRMSEKSLQSIVSNLSHWLIQDDINTISSCHQLGPSETETETETDKTATADVDARPAYTCEDIRSRWNAIQGVKPCKQIAGALSVKITRLCREHPIDWWITLFHEVAHSSFLTGKVVPRSGDKAFRVNLDWITGPINLGKILSGNYADETGKRIVQAHLSRPTGVVL
jgi:hypothetical protein